MNVTLPVKLFVHFKTMQQIIFLDYIPKPSLRVYLFKLLKPLMILPNEDLCQEGKICDELMFVVSGSGILYRKLNPKDKQFHYNKHSWQNVKKYLQFWFATDDDDNGGDNNDDEYDDEEEECYDDDHVQGDFESEIDSLMCNSFDSQRLQQQQQQEVRKNSSHQNLKQDLHFHSHYDTTTILLANNSTSSMNSSKKRRKQLQEQSRTIKIISTTTKIIIITRFLTRFKINNN
jgi:hypothetical protein